MNKKYTIEYIRKYLEDKGCKLLEEIYVNPHTKIKCICSCGKEKNSSWNTLRRSPYCRSCSAKNRKDLHKFNYEDIKKIFFDKGCELLEKEYINNKTKMKYRCRCGNISSITLSHFISKRRNNGKGSLCKQCRKERTSGKNSKSWNPNREEVEDKLRIHILCKSLLFCTTKATGKRKSRSTEKTLGYSRQDLLKHLKKCKNYNLWKEDTTNYHIDHIIPIKSFVENGIDDPKVINSLDNLQILSAEENLKKSGVYEKQALENFLEKKGIILCV